MNRWKKSVSAAVLLVMATGVPAWAGTSGEVPSMPSGVAAEGTVMSLSGQLTYIDVEGGYYALDGWRLNGDPTLLRTFAGKEVIVTGTPFEGVSIQMVKAIDVTDIRLKGEGSTSQQPAVEKPPLPKAPLHAVEAGRAKPDAVAFDGRAIPFDQQPVLLSGVLMVPLRFVIEAAGGTAQWNQAEHTVTVRLSDRTALFQIGTDSAEMNEDGVQYVQRNLIKMAQPPVIVEGRTLISADALSRILGFMERSSEGGTMDLMRPTAGISVGKIAKLEKGDSTRILVEGGPMANGEPNLLWVTLNEKTAISVRENGQDRSGSLSDLAIGQQVDVQLAGPILKSYPAQGGASAILIRK